MLVLPAPHAGFLLPEILFLAETPFLLTPEEVLVLDGAAPAAAAPEPEPQPVAVAEPPPEDAFPTRSDLDAILAALTTPPPGPDAAARAELAAVLGLDPAIAEDPGLFDATLATLPEPDADAVLAQWLSEAGAIAPEPWPPEPDWALG